MHQLDLKAVLISSQTNIQYLTGHPASDAWLLITPRRWYYITDSRYTAEASMGVANADVYELTDSIFAAVDKLLKRHRIRRVGFEEHMLTYYRVRQFSEHCQEIDEWVPIYHFIENFRVQKVKSEINMIKNGLQVHQKALNYLKRIIRRGVSEREVYIKLDAFVKRMGVDFSFPPIVASGPNSSYPHALITDRVFGVNDVILVDMGIDIDGYKTDLTRMFFLGKISQLVAHVHDTVKAAQRNAIKTIRPGVPVSEADLAARQTLADNNLAHYFGHALGHGVGLDIHENPRLSQKSPEVFVEGMVVTVEPGVYFPHEFGIRLEEMVLVTKKGSVVISDDID
jgi:Xaa-Pro aminopeptidase